MDAFSWESMAGNLQDNAFGDKKGYDSDVDTRFWKLSRDENDNGGAIIRFIPDPNKLPLVHMTRINASKGKKQFFVSEWSPTTIGLPCPFNEKFSELWNAGEKDTAKTLGRSQRYITNIKVITDPANPANEGKIFLYDMSQTMMDMIKGVMIQTDAMKALDEEPIAVYNPVEGNNFLIKAKRGSNGIITYSDSKFASKVTSIYANADEAMSDLNVNAYALKEFLDPTNFKSYEELTDKMNKFLKIGKYAEGATQDSASQPAESAPAQSTAPVIETGLETASADPVVETQPLVETAPVVETQPASTISTDDELDSLLSELD